MLLKLVGLKKTIVGLADDIVREWDKIAFVGGSRFERPIEVLVDRVKTPAVLRKIYNGEVIVRIGEEKHSLTASEFNERYVRGSLVYEYQVGDVHYDARGDSEQIVNVTYYLMLMVKK